MDFRMRERFAGESRRRCLVVAGQRQPIEVHLLAHAINSALGAIGNTVTLIPAAENSADLKNLTTAQTDTLVILGGNPAYNLNWSRRKSRRRLFVSAITKTKRLTISNGFPRGALSRIVGRCDDQRRHARADPAVDSAVVRRIDGIGIPGAHRRRIADKSSRHCPRDVCGFRTKTGRNFCSTVI